MSSHVMSRHVTSCHVMSRHVVLQNFSDISQKRTATSQTMYAVPLPIPEASVNLKQFAGCQITQDCSIQLCVHILNFSFSQITQILPQVRHAMQLHVYKARLISSNTNIIKIHMVGEKLNFFRVLRILMLTRSSQVCQINGACYLIISTALIAATTSVPLFQSVIHPQCHCVYH